MPDPLSRWSHAGDSRGDAAGSCGRLGDEVAIRTPGTGPFALASYFVGTQDFLIEVGMAERELPGSEPDAIHRALELAAEALIAFGKACFDAGC